MKIIDMLLDYLPERYVDAIVNNMHNPRDLHDESSFFEVDMLTLFDWHSSKQGYDFWECLVEAVLSGDELPPLPLDINYMPSTYLVGDNSMHVMNVGDSGINMTFNINLQELKNANQKAKEKFYAFVN
jgi:hypothetical protein